MNYPAAHYVFLEVLYFHDRTLVKMLATTLKIEALKGDEEQKVSREPSSSVPGGQEDSKDEELFHDDHDVLDEGSRRKYGEQQCVRRLVFLPSNRQ